MWSWNWRNGISWNWQNGTDPMSGLGCGQRQIRPNQLWPIISAWFVEIDLFYVEKMCSVFFLRVPLMPDWIYGPPSARRYTRHPLLPAVEHIQYQEASRTLQLLTWRGKILAILILYARSVCERASEPPSPLSAPRPARCVPRRCKLITVGHRRPFKVEAITITSPPSPAARRLHRLMYLTIWCRIDYCRCVCVVMARSTLL